METHEREERMGDVICALFMVGGERGQQMHTAVEFNTFFLE